MHAFCRGNGESRTEVKPKLSPKHAPRARAGTGGFYRTDRTHLAKQIFIGGSNHCTHHDDASGRGPHYSQTHPPFFHPPTPTAPRTSLGWKPRTIRSSPCPLQANPPQYGTGRCSKVTAPWCSIPPALQL